jgi:chromate transporter
MKANIATKWGTLLDVSRLFLKLGLIAFGGPAAHIAMFHDETVVRRKWLDDQRFLDLLGAVNLIPGPNSTEMAIHIGFIQAGWPGLILAGVAFILPAMLLTMLFGWVYSQYGTILEFSWLLYGVKPVVIAIIAHALWTLFPKAVKGFSSGLTVAVSLVLYFLGFNPLFALAAGGILGLIGANFKNLYRSGIPGWLIILPWIQNLSEATIPNVIKQTEKIPFNLATLFLTFLKIGSVLYGSGYVLLAFLRADFVVRLGWLTDQQLLEAVAIGQVTPGPVFTTATFIGYILGGVPGALAATLGIFLPSFIFILSFYW